MPIPSKPCNGELSQETQQVLRKESHCDLCDGQDETLPLPRCRPAPRIGTNPLVPANTTTNGFVPAPAIATSPPMTYRDHAPPDSDSARPIASAAAHLGPLADP